MWPCDQAQEPPEGGFRVGESNLTVSSGNVSYAQDDHLVVRYKLSDYPRIHKGFVPPRRQKRQLEDPLSIEPQ